MAFILDTDDQFERRANGESIVWQRLASGHWEAVLKELVEDHAKATGSKWSAEVPADWDRWRGRFWRVCPKEMLSRLTHSLNEEAVDRKRVVEGKSVSVRVDLGERPTIKKKKHITKQYNGKNHRDNE